MGSCATVSEVMADSVLAYLGLILILGGLPSFIWPMRFSCLRTRSVAAIKLRGRFLIQTQWKLR
jgi:hypothetical protein